MKNTKYKYSIAITFIWIGFVCAISFMEAWLKFQAPGITTKLGLGIGQLVFDALNKIEIVCALLILMNLFGMQEIRRKNSIAIFFYIPLLMICIQSIWLLPALDNRANLIIQDIAVPKSKMHMWYVLLEIIKVVSLSVYAVKLFANLSVKFKNQ